MTMMPTGRQTEEMEPLPQTEAVPAEDMEIWEELPGRAIRKRLTPAFVVLCGCVVAAGAFYAGVRVEKSKLPASATGTAGRTAAARTGAAAGGGAAAATGGGAAGGARAGTTGSIRLIDGNNIYVTLADGTIVKVTTNPGTTISVTSTGTVASLHPGDIVSVTGPAGADGTVTATAVRDAGALSALAGGGFGGGFGGGGGGAGAGARSGATGGAATGGAATRGGATGGGAGAAAGGG